MLFHGKFQNRNVLFGRADNVALLVVVLAIVSLAMSGCKMSHAAIPQIITEVLVATPVQRDVPMQNEWVATTDGYVNAEIRPQVSGYIVKQDYKEGSFVHKGEVLFEIDPRPFQATLDRAKADLAQAEAQLGKSRIDVERDTPLAEKKAIPKEKLDNEIQAKLAAEAEVEAGKAAVERAELDLGWTKVTSLVDGVAGIAEVQMGNLVGPQVAPHLGFAGRSDQGLLPSQRTGVSASQAPQLQRAADGPVRQCAGADPGRRHGVSAQRQDSADRPASRPQHGTIRLVAAFPNPGNILRPGQYGRVRIQTSVNKDALLVPQSAVQGPSGWLPGGRCGRR